MDVSELILGGVLGAILGMALPFALGQGRNKLTGMRVRSLRSRPLQTSIYDWILKYHLKQLAQWEAYIPPTPSAAPVPFFTKPEWLTPRDAWKTALPLVIDTGNKGSARDRANIIMRRTKLGQTLFNAPNLCLTSLREEPHGVTIIADRFSYYDAAASMIQLEDETARCAARGRGRAKFREAQFGLSASGAPRDLPFSLGGGVVLLLGRDGETEVVLHRRSHKTLTYGGAWGVFPYFGFSPFGAARGRTHAMGTTELNLVREYCEELFNQEDLVDERAIQILDPSWLLGTSEARRLVDQLDQGGATLTFTGFGIDGLNGNPTLGLLLHIKDGAMVDHIKEQLRGNWEVDDEDSEGVLIMKFDAETLAPLFEARQLTYGSAFCLGRALELMS